MNETEIKELRELAETAAGCFHDGWTAETVAREPESFHGVVDSGGLVVCADTCEEVALFIAAARSAVPRLLHELDAARALLRDLGQYEPAYASEGGDILCIFCGQLLELDGHGPECLWVRARESFVVSGETEAREDTDGWLGAW